jgi:hypothetical protein
VNASVLFFAYLSQSIVIYIYNLLIRTMQKRAAQSGDARNDADEMARVVATAAARNDPGIDVVGVELRRMLVVPASSLSASNVKRRIATIHARARCENCPPYDATRAPHDQLPRCWGCLVLRALHRRDKCVKCHAKLSDLKRSVYRVERVVDSWRTKVDPLGGKVHRDRSQQPAPRRVRRRRDQWQASAAVLA